MFWGKPDVSVSFCEEKYVVSDYIAEYYNTMSALSYVIVGIYLFTLFVQIVLEFLF